jgi:hypothetical protein
MSEFGSVEFSFIRDVFFRLHCTFVLFFLLLLDDFTALSYNGSGTSLEAERIRGEMIYNFARPPPYNTHALGQQWMWSGAIKMGHAHSILHSRKRSKRSSRQSIFSGLHWSALVAGLMLT